MTARRVNPTRVSRRLVSLLDNRIADLTTSVDAGKTAEFHAGLVHGLRLARQTISKG
nr:hypothetical protein [Kibdelosporangium sp. MJ126-NF4]CEL16279.1 hypothetical protein [Kibdelosporangium sp. MJ126-NF4]CTQ94203.1 hypothetical protein [Kibdelosporangium sp. MJ126-NF4]